MNIIIGNTQYNAKPPNICPHCHVVNTPHKKYESQTIDTDDSYCNIQIWQCSNQECGKLFGVLYKDVNGEAKIVKFLNGLPKGPNWPKPISDLKDGKTIGSETESKSKFIKTYLQSLEAESNGLDEIAGMGYRKAIEYLVKDWAIQSNSSEKDKILGQWLSAVIKTYFKGDLKDILERATWLGNDQTHYNKLFEEYNIEHLKELIDLIMVELDREYKKQHYITNIERKK